MLRFAHAYLASHVPHTAVDHDGLWHGHLGSTSEVMTAHTVP